MIFEQGLWRIAMAHKLIHADRAMRGATIDTRLTIRYSHVVGVQHFGPIGRNITVTKTVTLEELATIKFGVTRGGITENMIRDEQGLPRRFNY